MAQAFFFSSTAQPTTLSASISNTTTSIPLVATTGFPVSFPFTMALDYGTSLEELVTVNSLSGLNANVIRGVDGTSAAAHSVGAPVRHVSAARDFNNFYIHIGNTAGVHGIIGNVVGDTDTQTLANKTLTSPTINGAALSGTLSGTPTFSGNVIFSGNPNFTGTPTFTNATFTSATLNGGTITGAWTANNPTFTASAVGTTPLILKGLASQTADLFDVQTSAAANILRVLPAGVVISNQATGTQALVINAISGTTVDMVDFQSNGVTALAIQSSGIIQATSTAAGNEILGSVVPSVGSFDMFRIDANGELEWGPGTGARDINLQRTAASTLTLAGSLTVNSTLTAIGNVSGSNLNQTSSVQFTGVAVGGSLQLNNGTVAAWYSRAGAMWHYQVQIVCGSTSTLLASGNLTITTPVSQTANVPGAGTAYFTKTSGGAFNAGIVTLGTASNSATVLLLNSSQQYSAFNTTNGAAVAAGTVIVIDLMINA